MNKGLLFLLVFTPLAFGTTEPWSIAIMEIVAFSLVCVHAARSGVAWPDRWPLRAVLVLFLALVGLVVLQQVPLPDGILGAISPASREIWQSFGGDSAGARHTASVYAHATRQGLLQMLAYAGVFVVVVRECRTRAQVRFLAKTILFMGGFLAAFAIVQKLTWNGRIFWVFPVSESIRSGAGIWGPYINRNHFAGYMAMAIPLGLGMLMSAVQETGRQRDVSWGARLGRFLAGEGFASSAGIFVVVLLMTACLVSTGSRGAMVAWAVSSVFFAVIIWRRRSLRVRAITPLLVAAAVAGVVLLPPWERLERRFEDLEQRDGVVRLRVADDSLGIIGDFPLVGSGLGTFGQIYRRYQTAKPRYYFDHAHNDYVELVTDTGVVGGLLVAGMVVVFTFSLIRRWRQKHSRFGICLGAGGLSSCLAIAVHSAADFNLHIPANALLLAVIAGLTHAAIFNRHDAATEPSPANATVPQRPPFTGKLAPALVAIALASPLVFFSSRALLADYRLQQVDRILDNKRTPKLDVLPVADDTVGSYLKAIAALREAVDLEPSRSDLLQSLANLYGRLAAWAKTRERARASLPAGALPAAAARVQALTALRRAISLEPTNPNLHLFLAQLWAEEDGNIARAEAQVRVAVAAHPMNTPLRLAVARLYLVYGSPRETLERARDLALLDDSYLIPESAGKAYMIERRAPGYLARLKDSYLFKALDIAWTATGDVDLAKSIAPPNSDATAVLEYFLEWNNLE